MRETMHTTVRSYDSPRRSARVADGRRRGTCLSPGLGREDQLHYDQSLIQTHDENCDIVCGPVVNITLVLSLMGMSSKMMSNTERMVGDSTADRRQYS